MTNYSQLTEGEKAERNRIYTEKLAKERAERKAKELEQFKQAYITCLLWSECDDNDEPLEYNYDESDFSPAFKAQIDSDCEKFFTANYDLIKSNIENAGHDFWLTRNGHGAGFWDGDWPEHGDTLTTACKEFKEVYVYVGDDNLIYS